MRRAFLLVSLVAVACSNKLGGGITVNGEALEMDSCRSGAVYGFRGVEVVGKNGTRVRIAATMTGEALVAVLPAGADTGPELGRCGTLAISDQNSTINNVKNVEGKAELSCEAGGFAVKGSLSFANCH